MVHLQDWHRRSMNWSFNGGTVMRACLLNAVVLAIVSACGPLLPRGSVSESAPVSRVTRVGFLSSVDATSPLAVDGYGQFLSALGELGHEIGGDIIIEYRSAEGDPSRYPSLVDELVGIPIDQIVIGDLRALLPALERTSTVPIVTAVGDVAATGLVSSLGKPSGNLTGMSNLISGLSAKRLELLKSMLPSATRVAMIRNPTVPGMQNYWDESTQAAAALDLQLFPFDVQRIEDIPQALESINALRPDALAVLPEPLTNGQNKQIAEFAAAHRLPSVYGWRAFLDNGGLLYLGYSRPAVFRRTALFVHRIIEGASPGDLPVEQPTRFDLMLNGRAAQALGIQVSDAVRSQVTEMLD
jgi:putative tryptophan/tyrosine transport system substrate-binding protein